MDPANVKEFGWALESEETLTRELEREAREALAKLEQDPAALLEDFELPESDRAALEDPGLRQMMQASLRESFHHGVGGWIDDDLAFIKPWGFDVAEIRVPVQIRYGSGDVLVPAAHGAWLAAHVPGATVQADQDGGHLTTPDDHLQRLRELVAA